MTAQLTFTDRAHELIGRIDGGESVGALAGELSELRELWQTLDDGDRADARAAAAALGARTQAPRPRLRPNAGAGVVPDRSQHGPAPQLTLADDQAAARRAIQGLSGLAPRAPLRPYDGPPDPDLLLAHYGLGSFRPGQREAVDAALAGRDALVIMPTGGGKSVCYTLPGLARTTLTVVVSPLIALMADQYRRLAAGGHPAVMLASGLPEDHNRDALAAIRDGEARIVLCSPERFASRAFEAALTTRTIGLLAIDEAHCLSEWGHDFRPDYLRLLAVRERLGHPPTMACTATATPQVAAEITARLALEDPLVVHGGFDRPNLSFDVVTFEGKGSTEHKLATLTAIARDPANRPAIVYAGTRKDVDGIADRLRDSGLSAVGYHAGMEPDDRAAAQTRFLDGDADVVVATNAFGMGIDKADVRTVVHAATPTSVEAYYQEAGRAGRDGAPARAVLLAMRADLGRLIRFIERQGDQVDSGTDPRVARERGWQAYRAIESFVWGDPTCRRQRILDHFGDAAAPAPEGRCCDVCDPPDWLPTPAEVATATRGKRRSPARSGAAGTARSAEPEPDLSPADAHRFDALVAWRRETADGKPAYTVASNATLRAIATTRPATPTELARIRGVGPAFIERYASAVLELVAG